MRWGRRAVSGDTDLEALVEHRLGLAESIVAAEPEQGVAVRGQESAEPARAGEVVADIGQDLACAPRQRS